MKKEVLISSLVDAGICHLDEVRGVTPEEVARLEANIGKSLPSEYREFLSGVGRGAGRFLNGTDIFFAALDGLREDAIQLLRENEEDASLPDDAFVFSMHQGYEFTYFKISDGDDPPVYQYVEGNGSPSLAWNSFNDFLVDAIAQNSRLGAS
ncbi:SMI1/KNR4 family protein [Duganella sp. Root198D2]|uniref:SMI1/KNR4 family protein n=1 Tax=Duganella sp. Root198D2 TaxID=1736489 RepID=UPI0009E88432|nr:SMI1/KNR4 family protein [Duganella sp. Root198D2]